MSWFAETLGWAAIWFIVIRGLILHAEACSRAFDDVEAESDELEAIPCDCVIDVDDNRVPLVVSGRAVEVER